MSNYQGQGQYGENQGYDEGYNNNQRQEYGNQPRNDYNERREYGEERGFDNQQQQQYGEEGERGFFGNAGQAISNFTYKDETYVDKHGVTHNKVDKSHVIVEGLGVAAVGGLAYTAYEKFEHRNDGPEQRQQQEQGEGNFFRNEDGSIRKTHAAIAGIGAVGAGLLAKKLYDEFEERDVPKEHGKHHENRREYE
ncbi:hypothetical protein GGI21_000027 [Coemansia aciculifera]|uniref:Uncharacterized protein n=1 Tax=Coemansia aciculifera TaxID=417176 RepID=A0ACC1LUD8_9FUNG|nr:hypothetical protein IWW38_005925 [Coemansia aciculifera]KAJ2911244.1 hypothetical protein GGI21_000027 [Coemansia aciculifera]